MLAVFYQWSELNTLYQNRRIDNIFSSKMVSSPMVSLGWEYHIQERKRDMEGSISESLAPWYSQGSFAAHLNGGDLCMWTFFCWWYLVWIHHPGGDKTLDRQSWREQKRGQKWGVWMQLCTTNSLVTSVRAVMVEWPETMPGHEKTKLGCWAEP